MWGRASARPRRLRHESRGGLFQVSASRNRTVVRFSSAGVQAGTQAENDPLLYGTLRLNANKNLTFCQFFACDK